MDRNGGLEGRIWQNVRFPPYSEPPKGFSVSTTDDRTTNTGRDFD